MRRSQQGFVLGVVVLSSLILATFIFSYHRMVVQQNRRAHHEQLGEVAGRLALTGVNILAEHINTEFDNLVRSISPQLLEHSRIPENGKFPGIVSGGGGPLDEIAGDFNGYLSQLENLKTGGGAFPVCTEMAVAFEDVEPLFPDTGDPQLQLGRDPVEKLGEVAISCSVEYRGLIRKAEIRRQFRVVSMVPGIFARFSLFVPYTPWYGSYNAIGVNYNGTIDSTYQHPIPTAKGFSGPLKIFNGTDSYTTGTSPNPKTDLANRGWIFLGPSPVSSGRPGPVILKIPSGYHSTTGGHFLFARGFEKENPNPPPAKILVVPPEEVADPAHFNLENLPAYKAMIGGLYQGFYTFDPGRGSNAQFGAGSAGLWNDVTTDISNSSTNNRYLCASSWLFPYGDLNRPSRTLMVGDVFAGFLKFYFLKDKKNSPMAYWPKITLRRKSGTTGPTPVYNPAAEIDGTVPATGSVIPTYGDLFKEPSSPSDPTLQGYDSFSRVLPKNFSPAVTGAFPSKGVAFNAFFDCLSYPGDQGVSPWSYPKFEDNQGYVPMLSWNPALAHPYYIPRYADLNTPGRIPGLHPSELIIRFRPDDGDNPLDNYFFKGDLAKFTTSLDQLGNRVTHIIDLSTCQNLAQEKALFETLLFSKEEHFTPPGHSAGAGGTWFIPKASGIFYVKRRDGAGGSEILELPGNLFIRNSLILVFGEGDVQISNQIYSTLSDGAPEKLCTIVAMKGNIRLGTEEEIDAYLVALKKGSGSSAQGGRLLAANGIKKMNIFGGLAIWEMGLHPMDVPTTMGDFPSGGSIRYNPRFNPGIEAFYNKSRVFIMEDKPSSILVSGGA